MANFYSLKFRPTLHTVHDKSDHCFPSQNEYGSRKNIFEIPPCDHQVIFITEFVLLIKIPPFYEVNSFIRKWQAHGGISKIFFVDLFYHPF